MISIDDPDGLWTKYVRLKHCHYRYVVIHLFDISIFNGNSNYQNRWLERVDYIIGNEDAELWIVNSITRGLDKYSEINRGKKIYFLKWNAKDAE